MYVYDVELDKVSSHDFGPNYYVSRQQDDAVSLLQTPMIWRHVQPVTQFWDRNESKLIAVCGVFAHPPRALFVWY